MSASFPDMEKVGDAMARVASSEIMPLFENLASHEIDAKKSGEVVTVADTRAENRLAQELAEIYPDAAIIGEEEAAADPTTLKPLEGDGPIWIIDPLDGTRNFSEGEPCFAVIVAFCQGGRTLAGWIHNPLDGQTASARLGDGAWMDGKRLKVAQTGPPGQMHASMSKRRREKLADKIEPGDYPLRALRYGCIGIEYIDLTRGELHFAEYGLLKPWDHAAGLLMHAEAGGYAAITKEDSQ